MAETSRSSVDYRESFLRQQPEQQGVKDPNAPEIPPAILRQATRWVARLPNGTSLHGIDEAYAYVAKNSPHGAGNLEQALRIIAQFKTR